MATYRHHGLVQKRNTLNPGEYFLFVVFTAEEPTVQKIRWKLRLSTGETGTLPDQWEDTHIISVGNKKIHWVKVHSAYMDRITPAPEIGDLIVTIFPDPNPKSVPVVIID